MPSPLDLMKLPTAQLRDLSTGMPYSLQFDDIYFHPEQGFEEAKYTFFDANNLNQRWQTKHTTNTSFNIGELGFGSGLNFLITLKHWLDFINTKPIPLCLHYYSVEKHPIALSQLKTIYERWQDKLPFAQEILKKIPPPISGFHVLDFQQFQLRLTLIYGDADVFLKQLDQQNANMDTWYFDGFNPKHNPELWSNTLFQTIRQLSANNCTFSTFTAASQVRKNLTSAGFSVYKQKGFGKKREMLYGQVNDSIVTQHNQLPPWFHTQPHQGAKKSIVIVGAGIAGCALANKLARRDWKVTIIDQYSLPAQGASGNKSALVFPSISLDLNKATQIYLQCFDYACHEYSGMNKSKVGLIQNHGLLFFSQNTQRLERLAKLFLNGIVYQYCDKQQVNQRAGINVNKAALYFPGAITVSPQTICASYLAHPNINLQTGQKVLAIKKSGQQWKVHCPDEQHEAYALCLCTGAQTKGLTLSSYLDIHPVRGQLSYITSSAPLANLQHSLCFDHYLTPNVDDYHTLGASYAPHDLNTDTDNSDTEDLIARLKAFLPFLESIDIAQNTHQHRVSFRCSSVDHLPAIGPLTEPDAFNNTFADLKKGYPWHHYAAAPRQQNAYVFTALGSKGILTAPLLAECLASAMNGESIPMPMHLWQGLHANRFLVKALHR